VLLTVHAPVVAAVVAAVALGVGVAVAAPRVAVAVGAAVALGVAAPPHAASRKLAVTSGARVRERYREIIGSSALCSSDLTRRESSSR
jgi:ABC-type transport system involved in cytochrome bd biosynthesis fused ATPase/permease subunit